MAKVSKADKEFLEKYEDKLPSLRSGKWVGDPDDHEERPGQTLVTRNHEVITRWADQRDAVPVTVPGSEHDGHLGVLRFDFERGADKEDRLEEVSWDEWFEAFDERDLVFIYQEHLSNGDDSNFFRLDNPHREDG